MKLTVELGTVVPSWGAQDDVTLIIRDGITAIQVASLRYSYGEAGNGMTAGNIACESSFEAPGEPVMVAAFALRAVYDLMTPDHEFLAQVFEQNPLIEFEV